MSRDGCRISISNTPQVPARPHISHLEASPAPCAQLRNLLPDCRLTRCDLERVEHQHQDSGLRVAAVELGGVRVVISPVLYMRMLARGQACDGGRGTHGVESPLIGFGRLAVAIILVESEQVGVFEDLDVRSGDRVELGGG